MALPPNPFWLNPRYWCLAVAVLSTQSDILMTGSSVPSMKQSLPRRFCLETWGKASWVKEKLKIHCKFWQRATDFLGNIRQWNKRTMLFFNLYWEAEIYFCHHSNTWVCTILSCSQKTVEKLCFWGVVPFCKVWKDVYCTSWGTAPKRPFFCHDKSLKN